MRTSRAVWRARSAAAIFRAIGPVLVGVGLMIGSTRVLAQPTAPAAQPPTVAAPAVPDSPSDAASTDSLSLRYRFNERYTVLPNATSPEILSQYQVGTRETFKVMRDQPQGTPARHETTFQIIYTERPAKITAANVVTDTVRRYDALRVQPARDFQHFKVPLLEKLTVWYRSLPGESPQLFSLTDNRPLREWEYGTITSQVFLPQLITLLPTTPKRVGDSWRIPRNAARALLGAMPQSEDYDLKGTLKEVRKGNPSKAILAASGMVTLEDGPMAVNARLTFTFDPKEPANEASDAAAKGAAADDPGTVEARGSIDEVRMALVRTILVPEGDGRLKQTVTREMHLARRPTPANSDPLAVPTPEPEPKSATSWLTYDDPQGRFHFRHPQHLQLPPTGPAGPDQIDLFDQRPTGHPDLIVINFQPPVKEARDRQNLDPDFHRRQLEQGWEKRKEEVVKGPRGWLPEADWAPRKRKVYRLEAALKPKDDPKAQRIYLDYYLVVFERNESFVLTAMTTQDPHLDFRNQAEEVIKTFDFGTSDGSPPLVSERDKGAGADMDTPPAANDRRTPAASRPVRQRPPASAKGAPPRQQPESPRPRPDENSEPSPFPQ